MTAAIPTASEVFHAVLRLRTVVDAAELDSVDLALLAVYVVAPDGVRYRRDALVVLDGVAADHPDLVNDVSVVRAWIARGLDGA